MKKYAIIDVLIFFLHKCTLKDFDLFKLDFVVSVGFNLPLFGFYGNKYWTQILTHLRDALYYWNIFSTIILLLHSFWDRISLFVVWCQLLSVYTLGKYLLPNCGQILFLFYFKLSLRISYTITIFIYLFHFNFYLSPFPFLPKSLSSSWWLLNYYCYIYTSTWIHTYTWKCSLLSLFTVALLNMCLEVVIWDWVTYQGLFTTKHWFFSQ